MEIKFSADTNLLNARKRYLPRESRRSFHFGTAKPAGAFPLELVVGPAHIAAARAHGMWTYEPRQGRKAATVVCSTSAVVTLASELMIYDLRLTIGIEKPTCTQIINHKSQIVNQKWHIRSSLENIARSILPR